MPANSARDWPINDYFDASVPGDRYIPSAGWAAPRQLLISGASRHGRSPWPPALVLRRGNAGASSLVLRITVSPTLTFAALIRRHIDWVDQP